MNTKHNHKFSIAKLLAGTCLTLAATSLSAQNMPQDNWYLEDSFTSGTIGMMKSPRGVAFGPNGLLFVPELSHHRVQVRDANGTYLKSWGGFNQPGDAVFIDGRLYVISKEHRKIQTFDIDGNLLFEFGSSGSGNGQFSSPWNITADVNNSAVEIYVSDGGRDRVQVFSQLGQYKRQFHSKNNDPRGLAIGNDGLVYLADLAGKKVNVFTKAGAFVREFTVPGRPCGLDSHGNRLAIGQSPSSGSGDHVVRIYDLNGTLIKQFGEKGSGAGQFNIPHYVKYDSSGNIWVSDYNNHRIQVFDGNGTFLRQVGEFAEKSSLYNPSAFALDKYGNHFVSDTGNHRVVVLSPTGKYLRTIANNGSAQAKVKSPRGIAVDGAGRTYVADSGNKRVKIFDSNGSLAQVIGTAGTFVTPWGIALNDAGEIHISDSSQKRIHVYDANGTFIRSWGESGNLNYQFRQPMGIAIGPAGDVYVADYGDYSIKRYTPAGDFKKRVYLPSQGGRTSKHSGYGSQPRTVALRQDGVIVTSAPSGSSWSTGYLWTLSPQGNLKHRFQYQGGSWNNRDYRSYSAVASGHDGSMTVLSTHRANRFQKYNSSFRAGPIGRADGIPYPALLGVAQPFGSTNLTVSYKVTDVDSAKVSTALLGFKNGGDGINSVLVPKTFVGDATGKLGDNVDVNSTHVLTWDLATDWNGTVGSLAVEVLAKDDRDLLDLHFVTIPPDSSNSTALTINRFPLKNSDFLSAWYWLLASGDTGIKLEEGLVLKPSADVTPVSPSGMAGELLWLDASDLNGNGQPNTEANGSKVAIWKDKSGNDLNASQSVIENQPVYRTDAGSGKPAISVSNHWLNAVGVNFHAKQIFVVTQVNSTGNDYAAILSRGGDKAQIRLYRTYNRYSNHDGNNFTGTNGEYRINGAQTTTFPMRELHIASAKLGTNSSNSGHFQNIIIGRDDHNNDRWNGFISEILIFDRFLSSNEQLQVEWYLGQKWDVPGPIPYGQDVYAHHTSTTPSGRDYVLAKMGLRVATLAEVTRALEATTPGTVNQFAPDFRIHPIGNPEKVNEFGIESKRTGTWVVPANQN